MYFEIEKKARTSHYYKICFFKLRSYFGAYIDSRATVRLNMSDVNVK